MSAGAARPADTPTPGTALAGGTRVNEFEILDTLGEGGFGIVYRARDHSLQRIVALKEYMPAVLAARADGWRVSVRSNEHVDTFLAGLRSFINEARLLAQFDHPALVKVFRVCEANGTAYMAMPLYEGATLRQALRARAAAGVTPPDEAWLRALIDPLLDALALLHRAQCLHRDIAPDNIILLGGDRTPPQPILLDFGAARRVIGEHTQALTVILKPGYAPVEQYDETAGLRQGPWTDIYALGAVVHTAITGKPPPAAVGRLLQDVYVPLADRPGLGRYGDGLLAAIDRALAALPQDRPQDVEAWRALLGPRSRPVVPRRDAEDGSATQRIVPPPPLALPATESSPPAAPARHVPRTRLGWWVGGALAFLLVAVVLVGGHRRMAAGTVEPAPGPAALVATGTPPSSTDAADRLVAAPLPHAAADRAGAKAASVADETRSAGEDEPGADAPGWVRETLREARQCLVARRYACTIQRAEEVLKSHPGNLIAQRMARLGREGLAAGPAGGRNKP